MSRCLCLALAAVTLGACLDEPSSAGQSEELQFPDPPSLETPGNSNLTPGSLAETASGDPEVVLAHVVANPFVVHEWGTFTSVQASDGTMMAGLHHEEEPLPAFVYGRDPLSMSKNMEGIPAAVTQKMETPVVYFYGQPDSAEIRLEVDFPDGIISQWYPDATSFAPEIGNLSGGFSRGSMAWDLTLLDSEPRLEPVAPDDIWAPSRQVAARPIRIGEDEERFVFYRGLGDFELPIRVTADSTGSVTITNESDTAVPAFFFLNSHAEGAYVQSLGGLEPGESTTSMPSPKELNMEDFVDHAAELVADELIASGLYEDEAWAMVNTWRYSYFQAEGQRVLYVLPREWTDTLLPMRLDPEPDELVRTLVGRIDVLTPQSELEALDLVRLSLDENDYPQWHEITETFGRFAEPRLRRALQQTQDAALEGHIQMMIGELSSPQALLGIATRD